jgi:plastocyanin
MAHRGAAAGLGLLVILAIAASLAACAPATAWPTAASSVPATTTKPVAPRPAATLTAGAVALVEIGDHWYIPDQLTVPVGTTVTWRMVGTQEHDVWAYDGSFHSPTLGPGMQYSHTFTKPGRYRYFCVPHYGDGMYGEVIVVQRG